MYLSCAGESTVLHPDPLKSDFEMWVSPFDAFDDFEMWVSPFDGPLLMALLMSMPLMFFDGPG